LQAIRVVHTAERLRTRSRYPAKSERMSSSEERFMNYAFTLEVSGIDIGRENYEDALFEAGCDDALIAVVNGTLLLDFHREGVSFEDAVKSASRGVELAGGKVVRVVPTPE
jgi:hypothetical protein